MTDNQAQPAATIAELERALAEETRTSARLRESVEHLEAKLAEMEARFEQRLAEAATRTERAEAKLLDQQERLNALGSGREESMRALTEARAELARIVAERDQLRVQLERIDAIQTETVALEEETPEEQAIHPMLPSIEELMASLTSIEDAPSEPPSDAVGQARTRADDSPSEELLAADVIFPRELAREKNVHPVASAARVLVYLDAQPPIKYPLHKSVITIGRTAAADIQVDDDFISRIHARIICDENGATIEDADSKNGIRLNSKFILSERLQHGDVISIGKLRFTYLETGDHND